MKRITLCNVLQLMRKNVWDDPVGVAAGITVLGVIAGFWVVVAYYIITYFWS
jgi:hypothetical protein